MTREMANGDVCLLAMNNKICQQGRKVHSPGRVGWIAVALIAVVAFFASVPSYAQIGASLLTSITSETDASSYAFPSATYSNDVLYICFTSVDCSACGNVPTVTGVSGAGLTFTEIGTAGGLAYSGTNRRIQAWRALVTSGATTGVVTATLSGTSLDMGAAMIAFTGIKTSGSNGADAVVQYKTNTGNGTGLTVTFTNAFANPDNRPVAFFSHRLNQATTPEAGYTELYDATTSDIVMGYEAEWNATAADTTPSVSGWTTGYDAGGFALEIAKADTTLLTFNSKYVVSSSAALTNSTTTLADDTQASQTFSLAASQTVLVIYQANSIYNVAMPATGMQNAISVDATDVAKSWDSPFDSSPDTCTRNTVFWIGTLGSGSHTIKGRFASNSSSTATLSNRVLLIYVLNGNAYMYLDDSSAQTSSSNVLGNDTPASFTFTPSGSCKALILYNITNSGAAESAFGKKAAINIGGTDYSQAEKSAGTGNYADSVFTLWATSLSAASTTVQGRFASGNNGYAVNISRRQLGVLLFADTTLLDTVTSDTPVTTTSSTLADDGQATINRTTTDARELLVVAMGTKRWSTASPSSNQGECYGIKIDSNDRANSRGSCSFQNTTPGEGADSVGTAYAETLAAGNHTIKGRYSDNTDTSLAKIDSRRIAALWLSVPGAASNAGSFTKSTTTGNQIVAHGLGQVPRALILWVNGNTDGTTTGFRFGFGVTDQSLTSYSTAAASRNGNAGSQAARYLANKALAIVNFGATPSVLAEATVTFWDATTFTLNWTTNNTQPYVIHFVAIGGSVASKAVSWTMGTATGNKAVTGVGFKPDVVIHTHIGHDFTSGVGWSGTDAMFGLGVMDGAGNQWADFVYSRHGQATSDTQRGQRTNGCIYSFNNLLAVQKKANFVSMDPDGFTVNFSNVTSTAASNIVSLALKGVNAKAGYFNKSTTTTSTPAYVQKAEKDAGAVSSTTITLPAASTSGNLIVLSINYNNQIPTVTSVTDNKGNIYGRAIGPTDWDGTTERAYTYYASNIIGGGSAITITITLSAAATTYFEIWALEYSGVSTMSPLDQTSWGTGTGTAMDSGSKTTTSANELLYGWGLSSSTSTPTGSGWTTRSTFNSNFVVDKNVTSTGSYNVTGTAGTGNNWAVHMLTFKAGPTQSVTGVGFAPAVVLLASVQNTTQASDTAVAETRFGFGASNYAGQGSSAFADANGVTTTSVQALDKTDKVFMKVDNNTSTINAEANLVSMNADGFTLDWNTNDAVATEIVYLALGPTQGTFDFRRPITIADGMTPTANCSSNLTSFPFLLSYTDATLKTVANGGHVQNSNGYDIIFRALDDTTCGGAGTSPCTLDHEIEKYDGTTGQLIAWVRIPTLVYNAATTIYIYYGDAAISSPTANPTGVWDDNYKAVWHLKETSGNHQDSTSFAHTSDLISVNQQGSATGLADGADNFSAVTQYVSFPTSTDWNLTGSFTLEAWVNGANASTWQTVIVRNNTGNVDWAYALLAANSTGYPTCYYNPSGTIRQLTSTQDVKSNGWTQIVCSWNGANDYIYVDGLSRNPATTTWTPGIVTTTNPVFISAESVFSEGYVGIIDEVRISNIARSACWVATEYNNQYPTTYSTYVTVGAEVQNAPTAVTLSAFTATEYEDRVLVEWKTGHEVNNLGFHIYREENGQLVRLTPEPVAGSALLGGSRTALTAGHHYHWWDAGVSSHSSSIKYWLKDIDLNGTHTMHGPVTPMISREPIPDKLRPELLSEVGRRLNERYNQYWKVQELKEKLKQTSKVGGLLHLRSSRSGNRVPLRTGPTSLEGRGFHGRPDPAANEVQRYLAGKLGVKLFVREDGWYRVTQPELAAAGLGSKVNSKYLQLYVEGQEQPIRVIGGKDERFGPRDAIEFYGVGLDTPFTDTRVYWLVEGFKPGKRVELSHSQGGRIVSSSFPYTVQVKDRWIYLPAIKNGEEENFFGAVVYGAGVEQLLGVKHLDLAASEDALLEVVLQGATSGPHRVKVLFNNDEVGEVAFEGQSKGLFQVEVPQAFLREGDNLMSFIPLGGEMDISLVDRIRLTYWHTYTADDNGLRFTAQGGSHLTLSGFSHPKIRVIDITDSNDVLELIGKVESQKGSYAISVRVPGTGQRTLLALTDERVKSLEEITSNQPSSWHQVKDGYDFVIVTHRDFLDTLQPLKQLRESQGLKVALIDVEDLYDEFSFGNKSPKAIKDFLASAKAKWHKPPRFVLLVGDASFDRRNYLGMGDLDFVPTKLIDTAYLETASDDWFVDLNNDGLPEMAIGRLPVQTAEETAIVVSKIVNYEKSGKKTEAILVADINDGFDFEGASEEIWGLLPPSLVVRKIYRSQFSSDSQANGVLLSAINQGPLLVNFIGHGSIEIWRGILSSEDAEGLINGMQLPFFVNMTCLNGYFQDPYSETLGEALIKAKGGGAIAVWTSSGLTEPDKQAVMNKELIRLLFNGQSLTVGEATARAKASVSDQDIRKTWILFGDPSTRLK